MARDERQEVIEHINEKYKEYSGYVGVAVELINPNTDLKATIKEILGDFVWKKTKRRPMILPIIMEV